MTFTTWTGGFQQRRGKRNGSLPFLLPLLDALVEGLQDAGVDGGDDVHRGIEVFLGNVCFPCVRKAAVHSGIAVPGHGHGEAEKDLLPFAEALDRVGVPIELTEVCLVHGLSPVGARRSRRHAALQPLAISMMTS